MPSYLDTLPDLIRRLEIRLSNVESAFNLQMAEPGNVAGPLDIINLHATPSAYTDPSTGLPIAQLLVEWDAITTDPDNLNADPVELYLVSFMISGQVAWSPEVSTTTSSCMLSPLPMSSLIIVRVRAKTVGGVYGPYSQVSVTTAYDTTPPTQPSIPVVSNYLGQIQVIWDGKDNGGGSMPSDFDRCEVHASTTSATFAPTTLTYRVSILAPQGGFVVITDFPYGSTVYVRLVVYDKSGNASVPSTAGSAVTERVSGLDVEALAIATSNLGDGAVTAAKIANATITSAKIGTAQILNANIANAAIDDAKISSLSAGKITTGTLTSTVTLSGIIQTATFGARVVLSSSGIYTYDAGDVNRVYIGPTGSFFTGQITATQFRSQGYLTAGYGYVEVGDTGPSDPVDEIRMFIGGRVSSMRNPSAWPGSVLFSTSYAGQIGNVAIGRGGSVVSAYRFACMNYEDTTYIDMNLAALVLAGPNMGYTGCINVMRDGTGHPGMYCSSGGTGVKFLNGAAQLQARLYNDAGYASMAATTYYYTQSPPQSSSSERYKTNITDFTFNHDALLGLGVKKFQYTADYLETIQADPEAASEWHIGMIAEDFDEAGLTELVGYDDEGLPASLGLTELGMWLLPIVADLRDRVVALESA